VIEKQVLNFLKSWSMILSKKSSNFSGHDLRIAAATPVL
jgi:hypothetical protein